jgi:hypothetical protein
MVLVDRIVNHYDGVEASGLTGQSVVFERIFGIGPGEMRERAI